MRYTFQKQELNSDTKCSNHLPFKISGRPLPLGMEDESIADHQINASSYYSDNGNKYEPWRGRLNNNNGYWSPFNTDDSPWIQVVFSSAVVITAVQTQGAGSAKEYVEKMMIYTGDSKNTPSLITNENLEVVSLQYKIN